MDDFQCALEMIYMVKSAYDHGKYDELLEMLGDITYEPDFYWEVPIYAARLVFADTRSYYHEHNETEALVMHDPVIYRYNLLCREYEAKNGVTEADNPYVERMEEAIRGAMRFSSYSYGCTWETKTDREKGSKIVLLTGPEFFCWHEVPEALFSIQDFYVEGVKELEGVLRENNGRPESLLALYESQGEETA